MSKYFKGILGFAFVAAFFASGNAFATETINEIHISSHRSVVYEGELRNFDVASGTDHVQAEDYGSNTNWAQWGEGMESWHGFGTETPSAVADGTTHYALRVLVTPEADYVISDNPTILFTKGDSEESENYTNVGRTTFSKNSDGSGYVYLDLGTAEQEEPEPVFEVTYDFNGGATFRDEGTFVTHMVSVVPFLNDHNLITCIEYDREADECHYIDVKRGYTLDHVTVNGVLHDLSEGDAYELNQDTRIVYYWNAVEPNKEAEDGEGNSIAFYDENEEREYNLSVKTYSFNMTEEELEQLDEEDRAAYEMGKDAVVAIVGDEGQTLAYMEILVCDAKPGVDMCPHDGPFTVRLKLPEDAKGYDIYKLMYIDLYQTEDGEFASEFEDPITCDLDSSDHIICVLPHLSGYALIGANDSKAPNTGVMTSNHDTLAESIFITVVAASALAFTGFYLIKKATNKE